MSVDAPARLAIAIPTYNRPLILEQNLTAMLPDLCRNRIPIYVSDDSTETETEAVIRRLAARYELIHYKRNIPSLGHDGNFFQTVVMPDADYVWYLGDSVFIKPGVLNQILPLLDSDVDFCFVNAYTTGGAVEHVSPSDMPSFLRMRTWYLTLSGATIYGRRPRKLVVSDDNRGNWTNFPQLGLILEYCAKRSAHSYWFGPPGIGINANKRSYWATSAFEVFVRDWSKLIRSFPQLFPDDVASEVIRSHALNTGLFGFKHLMSLRAHGVLSRSVLRQFEEEFSIATPLSLAYARTLCLVPPQLLKFLAWSARGLRGNS